jgi:hypothetical protein
MDSDHSAQTFSAPTSDAFALAHFGNADLGDRRLSRRLVKLASPMSNDPRQSIPDQMGHNWADLTGAYRFFSNPDVNSQAIQGPHRQLTRLACANRGVVLCVQDTTDLDYSSRKQTKNLGSIGDGHGRGILQHTALAVSTEGEVIGILAQTWHKRVERPAQETRRQRQARWTESSIWADTARAVGPAPEGCRFVQVGDRHSDVFGHMDECRRQGHGFVLRAMHDRYVDERMDRLWKKLQAQPSAGKRKVWVPAQRDRQGRVTRPAAEVELEVRVAAVQIPPPCNDPRTADAAPLEIWAVHVTEPNPPEGAKAIEWMLLSSEKTQTLEEAQQAVTWYSCRWVIEEWHKALKDGCRLEDSQLDDAGDIERLAAVLSVIAVRLVQLRDLAEAAREPQEGDGRLPPDEARAQDPGALQASVPWVYICIVAMLAKVAPQTLTPQTFWRTVARRGGWIGRKCDGRPGWLTVWRGWAKVRAMVEAAELLAAHPDWTPKRYV